MWGTPIYLLIYVCTGFYAAVVGVAVMPNALSVGSSGALCGIIGAWGPFILITWNQVLPKDRRERNNTLFLVFVTVVILVPTSFLPMVD